MALIETMIPYVFAILRITMLITLYKMAIQDKKRLKINISDLNHIIRISAIIFVLKFSLFSLNHISLLHLLNITIILFSTYFIFSILYSIGAFKFGDFVLSIAFIGSFFDYILVFKEYILYFIIVKLIYCTYLKFINNQKDDRYPYVWFLFLYTILYILGTVINFVLI